METLQSQLGHSLHGGIALWPLRIEHCSFAKDQPVDGLVLCCSLHLPLKLLMLISYYFYWSCYSFVTCVKRKKLVFWKYTYMMYKSMIYIEHYPVDFVEIVWFRMQLSLSLFLTQLSFSFSVCLSVCLPPSLPHMSVYPRFSFSVCLPPSLPHMSLCIPTLHLCMHVLISTALTFSLLFCYR